MKVHKPLYFGIMHVLFLFQHKNIFKNISAIVAFYISHLQKISNFVSSLISPLIIFSKLKDLKMQNTIDISLV